VPLDVLILRDPRESARKCSLTPLRGMPGIRFIAHAKERRIEASGRILLHADGEAITAADAGRGILILDCSWRRVPELLAQVDGDPPRRRLPPLATAYPRKSRTFADPKQGLASVEALYAALALLGDARPEILGKYPWAERFLAANPVLARSLRSGLTS
jgi:pre-rRNA-processing protein TSR3